MSAIAREKTSEMTRLGAGKCVRISVIARVRNSRSLFQSFLYAFIAGGRGGGLALVRISGVSVTERCPQGESFRAILKLLIDPL